MEITRLWREGSGKVYAADVTTAAGGKYSARLERGTVSWAEPDVWAYPECHGLERYYCPGHNGHVCFYGACDEIRVTGIDGLRVLAAAFDGQEHGALAAH